MRDINDDPTPAWAVTDAYAALEGRTVEQLRMSGNFRSNVLQRAVLAYTFRIHGGLSWVEIARKISRSQSHTTVHNAAERAEVAIARPGSGEYEFFARLMDRARRIAERAAPPPPPEAPRPLNGWNVHNPPPPKAAKPRASMTGYEPSPAAMAAGIEELAEAMENYAIEKGGPRTLYRELDDDDRARYREAFCAGITAMLVWDEIGT